MSTGNAEYDGIYRALGRVEGKLTSIEEALREERERLRYEQGRFETRLEYLEKELAEQIDRTKTMQSQVYSNKHGLEGVNKDLEIFKTAYTKGMGALAVVSFLGAILLTGFWWALTHLGDVFAAWRALAGNHP